MKASRKHGPFDTRWPYLRRDSSDDKQGREWETTPPRLYLVPNERAWAAAELDPEEAGARRLLAAMAAAHPREARGGLPRGQDGTEERGLWLLRDLS